MCDLYKCDNDGICDLQAESITGYILYSVDDTNDKMMLECINNKCLPININPGYYVDGSSIKSENIYTRLIKCNEHVDSCEQINNPSVGYYINGKGINVNELKKLLIYCFEIGTCEEYVPGSGYYINNDNTVIACIKDQDCIEATNGDYIMDICKDEYLGLIVKLPNEDLYLCSTVDIDKSTSGIYMTIVNSFPDATRGLTLIEYDHMKNTIVKVEANDQCTEDGQIIFKNDTYYYCTHVIVHETYENDRITLIRELTRYESTPISMDSVGSTFVINLGSEFKIVNIKENGKITMNYGKY